MHHRIIINHTRSRASATKGGDWHWLRYNDRNHNDDRVIADIITFSLNLAARLPATILRMKKKKNLVRLHFLRYPWFLHN